ncbi:hypothetical protein L204_106092 [Cryptococcus depauperatus]|nr:hypothetical protein L204_05222 [Cryptococcus depauperatus CBS 7855]
MALSSLRGGAVQDYDRKQAGFPQQVFRGIRDVTTPLIINERNFRGLYAKDDSHHLTLESLQSLRIIKIVDPEGLETMGELYNKWKRLLPMLERVDLDCYALQGEDGAGQGSYQPPDNPLYFAPQLGDRFEELACFIDGSNTSVVDRGYTRFGRRLNHLVRDDLQPRILTYVIPSRFTDSLENPNALQCVWTAPLWWPGCQYIKVVVDFHWPEKRRQTLYSLHKDIAETIMTRLEELCTGKCLQHVGNDQYIDVSQSCAKVQWNVAGSKRVKGLLKDMINKQKDGVRPLMLAKLEEYIEIAEVREAHLKEYGLQS